MLSSLKLLLITLFIIAALLPLASATVRVADPVVALLHPQRTAFVGDPLQLRSIIISKDALTASLTYAWTCVNVNNQAINLVTLDRSGNNAATATLNFDVGVTPTLPAGTYTFKITVTDPDATHVDPASVTPTGTASVTIVVAAAPGALLISGAAADPCITASPCQNGGTCSSFLNAVGKYVLSCACPTFPIAFYGPVCSMGIIGCGTLAGCVSLFSGSNGALGAGAPLGPIVLYGLGFDSLSSLAVGGVSVTFSNVINAVVSDNAQVSGILAALLVVNPTAFVGKSLQSITFTAPAQTQPGITSVAAYYNMDFGVTIPGSGATVKVTYANLMYYATDALCVKSGLYKPDGMGGCLSCPSGGICPGAGRVWPQANYYSPSEFVAPSGCLVQGSCLGANPVFNSTGSSFAFTSAGANQCATGFTGNMCTQCDSGYFPMSGQCFSCTSSYASASAGRILAATIIVVTLMLIVLSYLVAFSESTRLQRIGMASIFTQLIAVVGISGTQGSAAYSNNVLEFFTYINISNFDVQLLRSGCGGLGSFDFVSTYIGTIVFMVVVAVFFAIAIYIRYRRDLSDYVIKQSRRGLADIQRAAQGVIGNSYPIGLEYPPAALCSSRFREAILVLFTLFYLRFAILALRTFNCVSLPNVPVSTASNSPVTYSLYMVDESSLLCYTGRHMAITVVSSFTLLFYTLGLPLFSAYLILRAVPTDEVTGFHAWLRSSLVLQAPSSLSASNFLHAILKPSSVSHLLRHAIGVGFLLMYVALVFVYAPYASSTKIFLYGFAFILQASYTGMRMPYYRWSDTVYDIVLFSLLGLFTLIILGNVSNVLNLGFIFALIALAILVGLIMVCSAILRTTSDDGHLDEYKPNETTLASPVQNKRGGASVNPIGAASGDDADMEMAARVHRPRGQTPRAQNNALQFSYNQNDQSQQHPNAPQQQSVAPAPRLSVHAMDIHSAVGNQHHRMVTEMNIRMEAAKAQRQDSL